ncbi:MAG: hypothetical protein HC904_06695 [Blastochloris sp.]|nr:hypothetical protein [Blastochloris sp.]
MKNPAALRRQLDRWTKSGKILQLRREVYLLNRPYLPTRPHPFLIANQLRRSSYVSLQSALSYYGLIPEYVPVVTSVTGGRPEQLETSLAQFHFRHVQGRHFFGFVEREVAVNQVARLATPEKALADLLYLTPGSDLADYLQELRLEIPETFNWLTLNEIGRIMQAPKVQRAISLLHQLWKEESPHETVIA